MWPPTLMSFTHTSHFQSTAPKLSMMSSPFHSEGTVKVRVYQSAWSRPTVLPTPESDDSTANGTRMSPCHSPGVRAFSGTMAYCQRPLRFFHCVRSMMGRGYSCHTFSGVTLSDHVVRIRSPAGVQAEATAAAARKRAAGMSLNFMVIMKFL